MGGDNGGGGGGAGSGGGLEISEALRVEPAKPGKTWLKQWPPIVLIAAIWAMCAVSLAIVVSDPGTRVPIATLFILTTAGLITSGILEIHRERG